MASLHRQPLYSPPVLPHPLDDPVPPRSLLRCPLPLLRPHHHSCLAWRSLPLPSDSCKRAAVRPFAGGLGASELQSSLESDAGLLCGKLRDLLAAGEWQLADEETRRLIIVLAGENAVKRKYVFFSEVQFIPVADLATIDRLWRAYSNDKFGYSVQRKIWSRVNGDSTEFFKKVGWMKSLGDDTPQFTYRAFPAEFIWELSSSTPEGHLPLTNALRGTQLLKSLLIHPAFDFADEELVAPSSSSELFKSDSIRQQQTQQQKPPPPLSANYSF